MTGDVELYDRFVSYLNAHALGAKQAKTAVTICGALALEPNEDSRRQIRSCAEQASHCGVLVCSGQRGYYVPASPEEVDACTSGLLSQAMEMRARATRMREIAAAHFAHHAPERPRPALFALMETTA